MNLSLHQEGTSIAFMAVRFFIWKTPDDTMQTEQAFSDDGGKAWEVN